MNLPIIASLAAAVFFGVVAVIISVAEDRKQKNQNAKKNAKEDFTHIIVHELRAPITAIKDSAEVLITTDLKQNEQKKFLEIIHLQSKLLLEEIGSIMDAAKLEAGKFSITKTASDLAKTIKEQARIFTLQAEKKHITLILDSPSSLPSTSFDPLRIGQIINNLVSNSLKFTPEGGKIKITISHKNSLDKDITISVSDTGVGIPKEYQKHLFSKFYQANKGSNQITKNGTGLGLYLVKGIVKAHGGSVFAKSSPGHGTTISFTLPISN